MTTLCRNTTPPMPTGASTARVLGGQAPERGVELVAGRARARPEDQQDRHARAQHAVDAALARVDRCRQCHASLPIRGSSLSPFARDHRGRTAPSEGRKRGERYAERPPLSSAHGAPLGRIAERARWGPHPAPSDGARRGRGAYTSVASRPRGRGERRSAAVRARARPPRRSCLAVVAGLAWPAGCEVMARLWLASRMSPMKVCRTSCGARSTRWGCVGSRSRETGRRAGGPAIRDAR